MAKASFDTERREFVRLRENVSVNYRFLAQAEGDRRPGLGRTETGKTRNISGGGLLLMGRIPDPAWIPELLMRKIVVGVSLVLPEGPVEAITRVSWIEGIQGKANLSAMGLMFREITREDQDRIFRYVIRSQMPK
ncbi:MAG: PilZ domain-containing protein [Planctomycetota bacterium]